MNKVIHSSSVPIPPKRIKQVIDHKRGVVKNTQEQQVVQEVKLTRKQKAFADELIKNPKISATQAVKQTYNTTTDNSASQIATANLRNPHVQIYLKTHADKAITDMIEIAEYSKQLGKTGTKEGASYASVAVSVNRDILDRVHGKATQRTEVISKSVSVNIDLTGAQE